MYQFLFIFLHYFNTKMKDRSPRFLATLQLIIIEFFQILMIFLVSTIITGLEIKSSMELYPNITKIVVWSLFLSLVVGNFMYFTKSRTKDLLERWKGKNVLSLPNIIFVVLVSVVPVIVMILIINSQVKG